MNYVLFVTDNLVLFAATIAMLYYMYFFTGFDNIRFTTYVPGIGAQTAVMTAFFGGILNTPAIQRATQK